MSNASCCVMALLDKYKRVEAYLWACHCTSELWVVRPKVPRCVIARLLARAALRKAVTGARPA